MYLHLLTAFSVFSSCAVANAQWAIRPLEASTTATTVAFDVNESGTASGYTVDSGGFKEACIWTDGNVQIIAADHFIALSPLPIDNAGRVVGYAASYFKSTDSSTTSGFVYNDGTLALLQSGDSATFLPAGINDTGLVVGGLPDGDAGTFNISTGTITDLGRFGAPAARLTAVNNNGLTTGTLSFAGLPDIQAFVRYNGQEQMLTGLGGLKTLPKAINDSGVIVGAVGDATGREVAVSWTESGPSTWVDGQSVLLPILPHVLPMLADANASAANDVNLAGDIVGVMQIEQNDIAVLWADGEMTNLNTLLPPDSGWILNDATGINDSGQIVGNGTYHGQEAAFLLTPVNPTSIPEPAGTLLFPGLVILVSFRRRRIADESRTVSAG